MDISIIIPAYNEEHRIGSTIRDLYEYFSSKKQDFEIIVVFDGNDGTPSVVRSFAGKNVTLLQFNERLGKGRAVAKGIISAGGKRIGFIDADCPISPEEYLAMFAALDDADCVIASRYVKGSKMQGRTFMRKLFSWGFNTYVNTLFRLGVSDTLCGAKVFREDLAKKTISDIKFGGFIFDVEVLWKVKKTGAKLVEYPVSWKHVKEGTLNYWKDFPKMAVDILKLRFGGAR